MNPSNASLQTVFQVCSICHDQCVSACPVTENTHRQGAYPSRLATLAWELARGNLAPDADLRNSLQYCIHCGACTDSCVYIDQPVDVTPVVRWARQTLAEAGQATGQMRQISARIAQWGNPYADLLPAYQELMKAAPGACLPGGTLVLADAAELAYAPAAAQASLRLLARAGYGPLTLSEPVYSGWELWQFGDPRETARLAEGIAQAVAGCQAGTVITLSPESAYLLRRVYPEELGIPIPARVMTVSEAVQAGIDRLSVSHPDPDLSAFVVYSCAEAFQLHSRAAGEVLGSLGIACSGQQDYQPFHRSSFPEGLLPETLPALDRSIAERIVQAASARPASSACPAGAIVCTSAFALKAVREASPEIPVYDWSSFVLGCCTPGPAGEKRN